MLKDIRTRYGITQLEAATSVGIPLRTYVRYEANDDPKNLKYQKIIDLLVEKYEMSETNGVYTLDKLKEIIVNTIDEYKDDISFCYLFGSYAKGYAKDDSDVDICVNTTLTGLNFVGFIEKLHTNLRKNVDVIRFNDLEGNLELINEIMKDGIKIYG